SYFEILKEKNLRPAGPPHIEPSESKFGEPLEYTMKLEVLPEFTLADMKKVKVEKLVSKVTDQDVETMVQKLLKQFAEWNEVDRAAQIGDQLVIDFEGKIKGNIFKGGSSKDFRFELGVGAMLNDFEKPLIGTKAGEIVKFKIKFPKNYSDANVAGKKADFEVKIHKISEAKLPELDKDFFEKIGVKEGGEQELRAKLRNNMEQQLDFTLNAQFKNKLIDKLLEMNPIELPNVLVTSEIHRLQNQAKQRFGENSPLLPEKEFEETARKNVGIGLILNKFIEEQQIKVDSERVKAKIESLVSSYKNPNEVIKEYYQNKQYLREVESLVLEEQVMEKIQNQVEIIEKDVSFDEVMNPKQDEK
ncbi:MAG: trigger factor, partial [Candidatus Dadabacteria bacterium]|nr:trigger factor [Candidatus Dadabacteria bacterium]